MQLSRNNNIWQYIVELLKESKIEALKDLSVTDSVKREKMKLANINQALYLLGNPQDRLQNIIHIGGTNGKGSTSKFIESGLVQMGFTVMCYTSPHLIRLNERITYNQVQISNQQVTEIIQDIAGKLKNSDLSFFEAITIISLVFAERMNPDFVIYEVGLGGRFDATNIFNNKKMAIITNIGNDHKEILGETIEEIAEDKCHILKGAEFAICSNQDYNQVKKIFNTYCKKYQIDQEKIFYTDNLLASYLPDSYQKYNLATSIRALEILTNRAINQSELDDIVKNFKHRGRLEYIESKKIFLELKNDNVNCCVDGAHNQDGINHLCRYIAKQNYSFKIGVMSMLSRKELSEVLLNHLRVFDLVLTVASPNNKIQWHSADHLCELLTQSNIKCKSFHNMAELNNYICNFANERIDDRILVVYFGSLYFIGSLSFMK